MINLDVFMTKILRVALFFNVYGTLLTLLNMSSRRDRTMLDYPTNTLLQNRQKSEKGISIKQLAQPLHLSQPTPSLIRLWISPS